MRLNQLEYLQAIKKYGSISKAAQALYVSQPSISNAIKELELELNCELISRSNHGIKFTTKGEDILTRIPIILTEVETIKKIARTTNSINDHYSIAGPSHLANYVLIPLIESMLNESGYTFDVRIGSSPTLLSQLNNLSLDFGLIYMESISQDVYNDSIKHGIEFTPIYKEPLLLVCDTSNPIRNSDHTLDDLKEYEFLDLYDLKDSYSQGLLLRTWGRERTTKILDPVSIRSTMCKRKALSLMSLAALIAGNLLYPHSLDYLNVSDLNYSLTIALAYNKHFSPAFVKPIIRNIISNLKTMASMNSGVILTDKVNFTYLDTPEHK